MSGEQVQSHHHAEHRKPNHRTRRPRAWRSPTAWLTLIGVLAVGLAIDLGTKHWAFEHLHAYPVRIDRERVLTDDYYDPTRGLPSVEFLPWDLLDFHLVINRGAVFGIGKDQRVLFIGFTFIAILAGVIVFGKWTSRRQALAHIAIGCILAGGLGNVYDRWSYAIVRDFLHMLPDRNLPFGWSWPGGSTEIFPWVFNIADVLLLSGMAMLMLHINRLERRKKQKAAAENGDTDGDAASAGNDSTSRDAKSQSSREGASR